MVEKLEKRRSLTPNAGMQNHAAGTHAMRRGGARQTVSDRVTFRGAAGEVREGWALNVSRGGVRAILDEDTGKVELGEEYAIFLGEVDEATGKQGRIVWLQEEPDGFVVGVEYIGLSGTHRAAPGSTPALPPDASGASPASPEPVQALPAAGSGSGSGEDPETD